MLSPAPMRGVGMRPFPFGPPFSPAPQGFFFGSPFFVNSGLFFGFNSGFGRNAFFGGFGLPFFSPTSCFFNGISQVCFAQPFAPVFLSPTSFNPFFSPLGIAPFGLGPVAISPFGFSPFCPFGFSSLGFSPFGFNRFGVGTFGAFDSFSDTSFSDNSMVTDESGQESAAAADYGPYSYRPAPVSSSDATPAEGQGSAAQGEQAPLALIYLTDGTNYEVSDYWLEGGRFHYVTSYGGENAIDIGQLDLQRTVDENWRRGITFSLRP
jgi:hypothetical protein